MLVIGENFADQVVDLPVGQTIELRLHENRTTGFRWEFVADGAPSCAVASDSYEPLARAPGSGGEHAWRFKAVQTGECAIELRYRRGWAKDDNAASTFKLHIRVIK